MRLCLRCDDVGWHSNGVADEGLRLAQRFHEAMAGLPYLAGVIPACVDSDGLAWLQTKPQGLVVALHGYDHAHSADGCANEFRNRSIDEVRRRIAAGRAALCDVPVSHMILPFNAYAPGVDEACYLEAIGHIWGGGSHDTVHPSRWPTPPQPYSLGRVTFVPSWAPTYASTWWRMGPDDVPLSDALPKVMEMPGKAVLTLHITWEAAKCANFEGVRWLVDQIKDRVITAEEYLS